MADTSFTESLSERNRVVAELRRQKLELKPYTTLRNTLDGSSIFILGSGTSLYDYYKDGSLSSVFKYPVITINASIMLTDWESGPKTGRYWISNDALCRRWSYWIKVLKSQLHGIIRDSWSRYFREVRDFYVFTARNKLNGEIQEDEDGLVGCSSVPSALDLAIQMGCNNVFLLGVDHYFKSGKRYFWEYLTKGDQPAHKRLQMHPERHQKQIFKQNDTAYDNLNKVAQKRNMGVYNCNLHSNVDIFKKINLSESFDIIGQQHDK